MFKTLMAALLAACLATTAASAQSWTLNGDGSKLAFGSVKKDTVGELFVVSGTAQVPTIDTRDDGREILGLEILDDMESGLAGEGDHCFYLRIVRKTASSLAVESRAIFHHLVTALTGSFQPRCELVYVLEKKVSRIQ